MNSADIDRIAKDMRAAGRQVTANDVLAVVAAIERDGFVVRKP
jgi:hypothetical protein